MYKMLSNRSISFDDLELFDPNLYEQLKKLNTEENIEDLDLYFEIDVNI